MYYFFKTLFVSLIIVASACNSKKHISYKSQTINTLDLYNIANKQIINNQIECAENTFYKVYSDKYIYGSKKGRRGKIKKNIAWNYFSELPRKFENVNSNTKNEFKKLFSKNCCNCNNDSLTVISRKIVQPQSEYSHLSSIYKSKSYVFYILTDYDSITGIGRYFQTDAYYPRDAFSFDAKDLCPDCSNNNKLEFFTGVFYLTHSSVLMQDVICLLSPENDFNERKVFSIEIEKNKLQSFTKIYEYKANNYYPIVNGNYKLDINTKLGCAHGNTAEIFKTEIVELDTLKATTSALFSTYNAQEKILLNKIPRNFLYPLKGNKTSLVDSGWVYLGLVFLNDSNKSASKNHIQSDKIRQETFYIYKRNFCMSFNKEIKSIKLIDDIKNGNKYYTIKPFEFIKMRRTYLTSKDKMSNIKDDEIIGEASPNLKYRIKDFKIIGEGQIRCIWINIKKENSSNKI